MKPRKHINIKQLTTGIFIGIVLVYSSYKAYSAWSGVFDVKSQQDEVREQQRAFELDYQIKSEQFRKDFEKAWHEFDNEAPLQPHHSDDQIDTKKKES